MDYEKPWGWILSDFLKEMEVTCYVWHCCMGRISTELSYLLWKGIGDIEYLAYMMGAIFALQLKTIRGLISVIQYKIYPI